MVKEKIYKVSVEEGRYTAERIVRGREEYFYTTTPISIIFLIFDDFYNHMLEDDEFYQDMIKEEEE